MAEYMLKRYHKRMAEVRERLGGKCVVCGTMEDLDVDHIEPHKKEFTIGNRLVSCSLETLEKELAKCQLLCKPCHREKHKSVAPCGTTKRYWRGCRCDSCKEAMSIYAKQKNKGV